MRLDYGRAVRHREGYPLDWHRSLLAPEPAPFKKLPKVPGTNIETVYRRTVYEDRQGVLWIGALSHGLEFTFVVARVPGPQ